MSSDEPRRAHSKRATGLPDERLTALLEAGGGVIHAPELSTSDKRRVLRWHGLGHLTRLMRGLYITPRADTATVVRAVARAYPDAIFVGETAAWLNGQITTPPTRITAAHRGRSHRFTRFRLIHRQVPDDHWREVHGIRRTTAAMAAVDVAATRGAELIDALMRATRHPVETLDQISSALRSTPGRIGNPVRRRLVQRTTTWPWSEMERLLHDLFDHAGITGWTANAPLQVGTQTIHPDARFDKERLVVEADGFAFHSDRSTFVRDRRRQNLLTLAGWRVLRFTWDDLTSRPAQVVAEVHAALAM